MPQIAVYLQFGPFFTFQDTSHKYTICDQELNIFIQDQRPQKHITYHFEDNQIKFLMKYVKITFEIYQKIQVFDIRAYYSGSVPKNFQSAYQKLAYLIYKLSCTNLRKKVQINLILLSYFPN